jgi:hypothetical protein
MERSRGHALTGPFVVLVLAWVVGACSSSATPNPTPQPTQAPPASVAPASAASSLAASVASVAPVSAPPASAPPASADVTGTWSGTWKRDPPLGGGGTMTLHLRQSGSNVTGDITAQGSLCVTKPGIPLTGTFNDPNLAFSVTGDNLEVDYTATLAGTSLNGKLNAVTCAAGTATGTFALTKG